MPEHPCVSTSSVQVQGLAQRLTVRSLNRIIQIVYPLLVRHASQSDLIARLDAVFHKQVAQNQAGTNADRFAITQQLLLSKMEPDQTPLPSWAPLQVSRPNSNGVSTVDCIRALCR